MCGRVLFTVNTCSVPTLGYKLFNALSDSRTRRSRACWRVERDSFMRATASLSGVMLKLPIVW